jgi:hypothetical protein
MFLQWLAASSCGFWVTLLRGVIKG